MIAPFAEAAARLDHIPGVGPVAARVIIAEVGTDMTRFPTAAHLASWAKFSPGVKESAGRSLGNGSTGHGNRYLARVLGEAAVAASRTNTFLGERYRRIARRRGKKKAIVAVGRSILIIVWHLLNDPESSSSTSAPTITTSAAAPNARSDPTSVNSRRWATRSPCNQPPDLRPQPWSPATPDAFGLPTHFHFRISPYTLSGRPFTGENGVVATQSTS